MLEARHLFFRYPPVIQDAQPFQLEDISLSLCKGEAVGIMGPGGSGKSTLLQILAGLEKPDQGQVLINGKDIFASPGSFTIPLPVGLVFQFPELQLFEPTVAEDVSFGLRNAGITGAELETRVREALELVELSPARYLQRSIYHLSQGEKRRVAMAGVLALDPQFLLLDEPTAGLDAAGRAHLVALIRQWVETKSRGLLIASHDIDFLAEVVDKIMVLDQGKLLFHGLFEEVQNLPAHIPRPRAMRLALKLQSLGLRLTPLPVSSSALLKRLQQS